MEKRLFFRLDDGERYIIAELHGRIEHIKSDISEQNEIEIQNKQYTLTPVFYTDEEFKNIPES